MSCSTSWNDLGRANWSRSVVNCSIRSSSLITSSRSARRVESWRHLAPDVLDGRADPGQGVADLVGDDRREVADRGEAVDAALELHLAHRLGDVVEGQDGRDRSLGLGRGEPARLEEILLGGVLEHDLARAGLLRVDLVQRPEREARACASSGALPAGRPRNSSAGVPEDLRRLAVHVEDVVLRVEGQEAEVEAVEQLRDESAGRLGRCGAGRHGALLSSSARNSG